MPVLQRNSNGVLSRGANGVLIRAASSEACCCENDLVNPARLCGDGSIYIYSGHAFRGPGEAVFPCGVTPAYHKPLVHNGFFLESIGVCVYFDVADCRAPNAADDHILIVGAEYESCEECEADLP